MHLTGCFRSLIKFAHADGRGCPPNLFQVAQVQGYEFHARIALQRMNFYGPPTVGKCSKLAQDEEIAEKLWARTEEIVGHKFTIV